MFIREYIKGFVKAHWTVLKWGLFLASIVFMLMAIQIYMNYITIIENTESIKIQNARVQEEIAYINNFQMKYLDSNHAKFFLSHENNILKDWETVIAFKGIEKEISPEEIAAQNQPSPRDEWKEYIHEKLEKAR